MALFGGSFDPPHCGHVAAARAAANAFELDSVLFTPTGLQPLKPRGASASYVDRLQMAMLLGFCDSRFSVSDLDAPRRDGRPNYTVDTLEGMRGLFPDAAIFAIAGADSFLELPRWHRSQRLLELADWIVVSRPGFSLAELSGLGLSNQVMSRVHVLEGVEERVSATELRARLVKGEDCSDSVPEAVLGYVREHKLYR